MPTKRSTKGPQPWAGKSNALIPGFQYRVIEGDLAGEVVTIIDNATIPDGQENQRKLKVEFDGHLDYILPRQLDTTPVSMVRAETHEVITPTHEVEGSLALADLPVVDVRTMSPEDAAMALVRKAAAEIPLDGPMDPRLDNLRPDRHIADPANYVSRKLKGRDGPVDDITWLLEFASDYSRAENKGYPVPFALKGDTQSGKTLAIHVLAVMWAIMLGYPKPMPVFTLSGSAGVTDFQIYGQFVAWVDPLTGKQSIVWLMGIAEMAARAGGIFYVDEINAIAERFTTSMFSLWDWRHEYINPNRPVLKGGIFMPETIKCHPDFWATATYNENYEGMVRLNRAVHQRFKHIVWDYDDEVEKVLVKSDAVLALGKAFRQARAARKLTQPIGTAVLQGVVRDIHRFGVDGALEVFKGMFDERERAAAGDVLKDRTYIEALYKEEVEKRSTSTVADRQAAILITAGLGAVLEEDDPF